MEKRREKIVKSDDGRSENRRDFKKANELDQLKIFFRIRSGERITVSSSARVKKVTEAVSGILCK